jgi:2-succinyl-6-hydroxy-2,4-cyclohexadiene-1-carboxylate synthase
MVNTINVLGFPHAYELSAPTDSSTVLVFVHGWLLSRAYWQPVIQQLAVDYQCLSYDMRGFGDSQQTAESFAAPKTEPSTVAQFPILEKAAVGVSTVVSSSIPSLERSSNFVSPTISSYTPAVYAQDLVLLLQELNISRAWLIGHSLGGSIALWTAEQMPDAIAGVICINAGGGIYLKEEFEKFRTVGRQLLEFRKRWFTHIPFLDVLLAHLNVAQPLARHWGRQRLKDLLNAQAEAALGTLLDSTTEAEVHLLPQVVSRLCQPVHFIAGADDMVMESKYVNHLASFHASFECCGNNVSEIPNCGHLAMVEQPKAIANEIRAILTKHLQQ